MRLWERRRSRAGSRRGGRRALIRPRLFGRSSESVSDMSHDAQARIRSAFDAEIAAFALMTQRRVRGDPPPGEHDLLHARAVSRPIHSSVAMRLHACGYKRGNSGSRLLAGNRSETGPFGVLDASSPSITRSFSTRRAERSGSPVIPDASPRSTSPRTRVSSSKAAASALRRSCRTTNSRSRFARR